MSVSYVASFVAGVVKYDPALGSFELVTEVYECRVEDHLVVRQAEVLRELRQVVALRLAPGVDICGFAFDVLAGCRSFDVRVAVERRAAVPAVDLQRLAVGVPQWLQDAFDEGLDCISDFEFTDDVADAVEKGAFALGQLDGGQRVGRLATLTDGYYDIVVFDAANEGQLMPYSGTWVNLGHSKDDHRFLLCNNTRYEGEKFNAMDGFPFPVKLTITCPNRNDAIDTPVVMQLIDQVYQFSRIYWKSTRQQGLPVTIKYPEMIAEIMPHFDDKTIYTQSKSLWFL